ncbi:hypothetical protein D3C86_1662010 [compost metagenome]
MTGKKTHSNNWSGGSGRMVWEPRFLCHSYLFDRKLKKLIHWNLQSLGNLIDHAGSHIIFAPFNSPDLFTGIPHEESKVLLCHIPGQSQLPHPVSQGIQKIFVYHILHIQEWRFIKNHKSPYMGYFGVFDYFWSKKKEQKK